jgi:hypothetical protein
LKTSVVILPLSIPASILSYSSNVISACLPTFRKTSSTPSRYSASRVNGRCSNSELIQSVAEAKDKSGRRVATGRLTCEIA